MSLNVNLLRDTFKRVKTENGGTTRFGLRFYERLFDKYPGVKHLFNTPPEEQHKKLVASLAAIVASATNTDQLVPYLQAMAIRHLKYGTENDHYPAVAENLVSVLSEHLSQEGEWTEEMEATWKAALDLVGGIMIEAASHPENCQEAITSAGYQPDGFKANNPMPWLMPAGTLQDFSAEDIPA